MEALEKPELFAKLNGDDEKHYSHVVSKRLLTHKDNLFDFTNIDFNKLMNYG